MTNPTSPRLALILVDLDVPDDAGEAVGAVLDRVAQTARFMAAAGGVSVGEARAIVVPGMTAETFRAALASLHTPETG